MNSFWVILSLVAAVAGLYYAIVLFKSVMARDPGDEQMQKIARAIQEGAKAFLVTEYKVLAIFMVAVFVIMSAVPLLGLRTAIPFVLGATASAVAGYFGMYTATRAAVRTTQAAKTSLMDALTVAFSSGTVMGMTVVGLGLGGITLLYLIYGEGTN